MSLQCRDLKISLGKKDLLRGVNLDLDRQGLVGLLGPNGCGKSTWLRCLYRALKPSQGALYLDGKAFDQWKSKAFARQLAVLPQQERSAFDMPVLDMVLLGRVPHQRFGASNSTSDVTLARQALATVDLEGFEERAFLSLSGGERQRVLLARALCVGSKYLLLDEPTNHLDIKHQLALLRLASSLPSVTLAALHDLTLAAGFCRHLIVMKEGQVVASGTPQQVLTSQLIEEVWGVKAQVRQEEGRTVVTYLF